MQEIKPLITSPTMLWTSREIQCFLQIRTFGDGQVQSAAGLSFGVTGVFTTATTGTLVVLMDSVAAWSRPATERRRLAAVLVSLFSGAVAGGLLLQYARAYAPVLPLIGAILALAIAARELRKH
jgi:uncharacterized membrane protein YoaK (UPF0700 family)